MGRSIGVVMAIWLAVVVIGIAEACSPGDVSQALARVTQAAQEGNSAEVERTVKVVIGGALGGAVTFGVGGAAIGGAGIGAVVGAVVGAACGSAVSNATAP